MTLSCPSFKSVRFTKRQIFVEMFCTNLQSPVWSRHVGVPPSNTNMAAGNCVNIWNLLIVWLSWRLIICTEQKSMYIRAFPNTLTSE